MSTSARHFAFRESCATYYFPQYSMVAGSRTPNTKVRFGRVGLYRLTDAGFLRFKQGLDGFKEEGFRSESIGHDLLTLALQLGPWVYAKPKAVEIVSEQELRRYYRKELPRWVPKTETHRPDGFSCFRSENGKSIVAFEVEINSKQSDRYNPVFQYYSKESSIEKVIWLVKNKGLKSLLIEKCTYVDNSSLKKHHFILLEDFKTKFWSAVVTSDQKSPATFESLMYGMCLSEVQGVSNICPEGRELSL